MPPDLPRTAPVRRPAIRHRAAVVAIATVLALGALGGRPGPAAASGAETPGPNRGTALAAVAAPAPLPASRFARRLSAEVYGYLPYWSIGSWTDAYLRYDLLTDIALFSVGFDSNGTIVTNAPGYAAITSSTTAAIVANAHAQGVRVDLTVSSFGLSKNDAFFASPAAMTAATSGIVALVRSLGLDGVSVDVEGLDNQYFAPYGVWVGQVRTALRASNPAARVSVATNGSLSGAGMAVQALKGGADRVFIMGYSYRTAGSSPAGSIDPIVRASGKSLTWTLDLYASTGVPANRILLGLPYYGQSWNTTSGALNASTTSSAGIFVPSSDLATVPAGTVMSYDLVEGSRWFAIQDPTTQVWTETYFDDPLTLGLKYALAAKRGLAGIGIWALGYDRGVPGYWNAVIDAFGTVRRAGPDRYATAAAVADDAFDPGLPIAYVATGATFPDALAAAAAAGMQHAPVLLVAPTAVPVATSSAIAAIQPARIVLVGGPGAVSDGVLAALAKLAPGGATRIAGADRYATAAAVSAGTFPTGAPVAYLVNGTAYADAVSAAPAAARDGGPVLLTTAASIPPATLAELTRLKPTRIVIVGGTSVVGAGIPTALHAALPAATIVRLAGTDRYGTSAAVAATFEAGVPVVYAASGLAFPDALAAAAAAGAQGSPVLITLPLALPPIVAAQIARLNPTRAVVAGGTAVVSDAVLVAIRTAVAAN